ncbi:MAG: hypothetical protein ACPHRO_04520 [Nannocystaceae bacterium]
MHRDGALHVVALPWTLGKSFSYLRGAEIESLLTSSILLDFKESEEVMLLAYEPCGDDGADEIETWCRIRVDGNTVIVSTELIYIYEQSDGRGGCDGGVVVECGVLPSGAAAHTIHYETSSLELHVPTVRMPEEVLLRGS